MPTYKYTVVYQPQNDHEFELIDKEEGLFTDYSEIFCIIVWSYSEDALLIITNTSDSKIYPLDSKLFCNYTFDALCKFITITKNKMENSSPIRDLVRSYVSQIHTANTLISICRNASITIDLKEDDG